MNIDQRLEALTHSLELLASIVSDSEKQRARSEAALQERFTPVAQALVAHENLPDRIEGRQ